MATSWKNVVSGYSEIGVDWNCSETDTSLTYAPIVYLWYSVNSEDPYIAYSWNLKAAGTSVTSGSMTISTGEFSGSKQIDTYATRTISKTHSTQTLTLDLSFSDLYGGYGQSWTGSWSGTWTLTVPARTSYTVSYNANGGSGAPSDQTKWHDETLTLSSTKPTRSGYTFVGWGTSSSDTTADWSAGGSYTANASDTLYAIWKKTLTLSYNANNGSGAPSSQSATIYNATTSYKFTISSTKPTRTGYTFLGWSTSSSATSSSYSSGGSITISSNTTLYAVWSENALTVNYYSNYADYCTLEGTSVSVSASSNSKVLTQTFYYDNAYSAGLANVQNTSYLYLSRTGYTSTGYWGTSTSGGTLIDQDTAYSTGQALAEALGKSLASGNASVNIYAQWRENVLTVNYYSNYATSAFDGAINTVGADKNVIVRTAEFKYATAYSDGLHNYSTSGSGTFLERTRYEATGYWGTTQEIELGDDYASDADGIITAGSAIAVSENQSFASGAKLAEAFGKLSALQSGDVSINVYALWILLCSKITVYQSDGTAVRGMVHFYDDDGVCHYGILTVYGSDGKARVVI